MLAGGRVPALASLHLVTRPGGMLPTRSHGHQLCRAPQRKPKSCGAPEGHQQDPNTPEKMLPCPLQCTEQDAPGSAKDNPAALHRNLTSLALCPGSLWEHRAPFPQGNTILAGTWVSQGQPELTEEGGRGQAGHGAAGGQRQEVCLHCAPLPNSSQAAVRDSLAPGGKGGHPALSHPGPRLLTGHILCEGSPGTVWGPRQWQIPRCTRPAPRETAQLISSPLSLPVPSGLAGGSGSNRSEETAGSHVAASHQGLKDRQGCPRLPVPPQLQLDPNSQRAPSSEQSPEPPAGRDVAGHRSAL